MNLLWIPVFIILLLSQWGCAGRKLYVQMQCLDRPGKVEYIEGPVIINGDEIIYYDSKDKLTKKDRETCAIK